MRDEKLPDEQSRRLYDSDSSLRRKRIPPQSSVDSYQVRTSPADLPLRFSVEGQNLQQDVVPGDIDNSRRLMALALVVGRTVAAAPHARRRDCSSGRVPALPHSQARGPCDGRPGWFSQTQPQSS
jgi:hypothetical protein